METMSSAYPLAYWAVISVVVAGVLGVGVWLYLRSR